MWLWLGRSARPTHLTPGLHVHASRCSRFPPRRLRHATQRFDSCPERVKRAAGHADLRRSRPVAQVEPELCRACSWAGARMTSSLAMVTHRWSVGQCTRRGDADLPRRACPAHTYTQSHHQLAGRLAARHQARRSAPNPATIKSTWPCPGPVARFRPRPPPWAAARIVGAQCGPRRGHSGDLARGSGAPGPPALLRPSRNLDGRGRVMAGRRACKQGEPSFCGARGAGDGARCGQRALGPLLAAIDPLNA